VQLLIFSHPHFAEGQKLSVYKQQQALLKSSDHLTSKISPQISKEINSFMHPDYEELKTTGKMDNMSKKLKSELEPNPPTSPQRKKLH